MNQKFKYHSAALFTAFVWGTTFVASKFALVGGLLPAQAMLCRFVIGYLLVSMICFKDFGFKSLRDELLFASVGIFGGSLYFFFEYTAMGFTNVTNVGLICSTVPLQVAIIDVVMLHNNRRPLPLAAGSVLAFGGVAMVVFNGRFEFSPSLIGDGLAFLAALSWAIYSFGLQALGGRYSEFYITRKLFFYAIVTLVPIMLLTGTPIVSPAVLSADVFLPILYLGIFASLICLILWNYAINHLGVIVTNNYLYLMPAITTLTACLFLDETLTPYVIAGTVMICLGIWLADYGQAKNEILIDKEQHQHIL